jgi:dihydrodipicolinate synthase/N-acetylneuraminate lyase
MPVELVAQAAEHPNLIGMKESCGEVEKVGRLVASTRHIKHTATVTEVFAAVTGRMLSAPSQEAVNAGLVSATALAAGSGAGAAFTAVLTAPKLKTRTKEVGFQVLTGAAQTLRDSLDVGASGAILAFADPAPTACFEIYTAWKEGDMELAREKQERVAAAAKRIVGELSVPGIKYAMELNGYFGGPVRLPLLPPTAEVKAEVEKLMANIRN